MLAGWIGGGNLAEAENCEAGCEAALAKCRRASCVLKPTAACGSCCQASHPDGTKALQASYYAALEEEGTTVSACARECEDPATEECRACVVKYAGSSEATTACNADAKCKPMLECLDTCGGVDDFLGLE